MALIPNLCDGAIAKVARSTAARLAAWTKSVARANIAAAYPVES
jgi:hypothetical protein